MKLDAQRKPMLHTQMGQVLESMGQEVDAVEAYERTGVQQVQPKM